MKVSLTVALTVACALAFVQTVDVWNLHEIKCYVCDGKLYNGKPHRRCQNGRVCNPLEEYKIFVESTDKDDCAKPGLHRNPHHDGKYILCKYNKKSRRLERLDGDCPKNQVFDPYRLECRSETKMTYDSPNYFFCPRAGRFPDAFTCRHYFLCDKKNKFTNVTKKCPEGTFFNEILQKCSEMLSQRCIEILSKIAHKEVERFDDHGDVSGDLNYLAKNKVYVKRSVESEEDYDSKEYQAIFNPLDPEEIPNGYITEINTYPPETSWTSDWTTPDKNRTSSSESITVDPFTITVDPFTTDTKPGTTGSPTSTKKKKVTTKSTPQSTFPQTTTSEMTTTEPFTTITEPWTTGFPTSTEKNVTTKSTTSSTTRSATRPTIYSTSSDPYTTETMPTISPITNSTSESMSQSSSESSPESSSVTFDPDDFISKDVTTEKPVTNSPSKYICLFSGRFRDPFDCRKYYVCKYALNSKRRLIATHHTCKNKMWFSNFFKKCVKFKPSICIKKNKKM